MHPRHCTQCLGEHRNRYLALCVEGDEVNGDAEAMVSAAATVSEYHACMEE